MEEYHLPADFNINKTAVSSDEMQKQKEYSQLVRSIIEQRFSEPPKAFVHTYGCQGNVADGERLKGMLEEMGYSLVDELDGADLVLYNTCAIREHAEDRVFGNVGALKSRKSENRDMKILLCGCMMQQKHIAEKIRKSYPFVDIVFGTHVIHRLPEFLYFNLSTGKKIYELPDADGVIAEELPVHRDSDFKAWLPIMYGCNNFCSYCIVPYVRGRERSRDPETIIKEAEQLVAEGYKEITLLGQNVNSYGKYPDYGCNFAQLLEKLNSIEGDFIIRFMTSHPKDCTHELLDTMARCKKVARHLHLPFQSGSNRVLDAMNRRYTREKYLELLNYAYSVMPDLSVTSDVIVGFPGETYEEFLETVVNLACCVIFTGTSETYHSAELLWESIADDRDDTCSSECYQRESDAIVARKDVEACWLILDDIVDLIEVATCLLDGDNILIVVGKTKRRGGGHIDTYAPRYII